MDFSDELLLLDGIREAQESEFDTYPSAGHLFVSHIDLAGGVVPHENHGQTWGTPHAFNQVLQCLFSVVRESSAVENATAASAVPGIKNSGNSPRS